MKASPLIPDFCVSQPQTWGVAAFNTSPKLVMVPAQGGGSASLKMPCLECGVGDREWSREDVRSYDTWGSCCRRFAIPSVLDHRLWLQLTPV